MGGFYIGKCLRIVPFLENKWTSAPCGASVHYFQGMERYSDILLYITFVFHAMFILNTIHLLPSLEGDMKICPPRKFMSPEGEARGRHDFSRWDKSSCFPTNWAIKCLFTDSWRTTLYSTTRCVVKHDRETRRLAGDKTICIPSTWLLWFKHILFQFVHEKGLGISFYNFSRPIIFLYSSYQSYEVY